MNKKAFTEAFIPSLLFSLVAGTMLVEVARGNPITYPDAPSTDLPTLKIQPPQNHSETYASNTLKLNFSVTKPDSWMLTVE